MTPVEICHASMTLILSEPALANSPEQLGLRFGLRPESFNDLFKANTGISLQQFQQSALIQASNRPTFKTSLNPFYDGVKIKPLSATGSTQKGPAIHLRYHQQGSLFGPVLVVSSQHGIVYLGFDQYIDPIIKHIQSRFPYAHIEHSPDPLLPENGFTANFPITLHLAATDFQLQVWRTLIASAKGNIMSYKDIALRINKPQAARGIGQAVGANPVAFLIPCHRVIKQNGDISGYRWGVPTKQLLLAWEHATL